MAGSILAKARRDSKKYITKGGAEEDIILTSADGNTVLPTTGWTSKHWINFDSTGNAINSKNAHITLDEDLLVAGNYPVRNSDKEVNLKGHKVTVKDSSGESKNYVIIEWLPNETLGLIACILGDYELN